MKIAITGTKGIPNRYGGFEQFAEFLSTGLAARGHEVIVYNPSFHPYKNTDYKGVKIITRPNPEKMLGSSANILYDYLCLRDAIRRRPDVILECGYASAVPAMDVLDHRGTRIITHLDGMEWQRPKWNRMARSFIRFTERRVTRISDNLVCDHEKIAEYFTERYAVRPVCIRYGAVRLRKPDRQKLDQYLLEPWKYFLVISRLEPENNIEMIIEGYLASDLPEVLIIIGQNHNRSARNIIQKYGKHPKIWIKESMYDSQTLDNLRYFAKAYLHGHSVGGSNPSLLEAMAAGAFIIAHDNHFNRGILEEHALYFKDSGELRNILINLDAGLSNKETFIAANRAVISEKYRWERIIDEYEDLFRKLLSQGR
jgi:glycosyltransferase involved in cell wall biosynthesis